MFKKISASSKLFVLIFSLFALFLGLGVYNKSQINNFKKNSDEMYGDVIQPIMQLTNVRYQMMKGVRTTVKQLIYIDSSYSLTLSEIARSKSEINSSWNAYLKSRVKREEAIINAHTDRLIKETDAKIANLMATIYLEDRQAMQDFALREVYYSLETTIGQLTSLIEFHEDLGNTLRIKNAALSMKSKQRFDVVLLVFMLIALLLSYFIANDIRKLVHSLKSANRKLAVSEMKYRSVFESAADGMFVLGENKLIKAVNKRGLEITGYSLAELQTMSPEALHSQEDSLKNPFRWSELNTNRSTLSQRKLVRKDGEVIDIEMNTSMLGKKEVLSVVRDISDRIKSEKAHKLTEEKFALAVKSSSDIICITTFPDGVFVEINAAFSELTGYSSAEIIGQPTENFNFYVDPLKRPRVLKELQNNGVIRNQEIVFKKKNDELITTLMTSNLFYMDEKPLVFSTIRDITKEKLAHEELKNIETHIKELVDSTEAVIWEANAQTFEMTYVNPYVEKLFGYPAEDWLNDSFWGEHIHPDDKDKAINYCLHETKQLRPHTFEYRFIAKNGEIIWVKDIVRVIVENNQPMWLRGVMIDITEEKRAAEELELANLRLKKMIDSTEAIIWEANAHSLKIKYISANAECLYGYSQEEWYQDDFWLDHIYHDDKEKTIDFCESLKENPRSYTFEYRFVKKNGDVVWLKDMANVTLEKDTPQWFQGISIDITEQKKRESDLMELTTRLQVATKSAQLGIFDLDLIHLELIWDDASYQLYGLVAEEITNTFAASVNAIHPEDRDLVKDYRSTIIDDGGEYFYVYRIYWPNGEIRHIESSAIVMRDEKGKAFRMIGVNRDVTEIKLAQEQLLDANEFLEDKVMHRTMDLHNAYKKINDSINYAQNIQLALLAKPENCREIFPKCFVLWSPKDIVSGDLFWCHSDERYNYLAVIDCTGHGVPGAFLSIVAKQTLDNIVVSNKIIEPKDILSYLDVIIVNSLNQQSKMVNDGMDIVFCRVDRKTNAVVFAGAQRPLFYYDGEAIVEYAGNKMGIGGYLKENDVKVFDQTHIQGKMGDVLYLSSDGYYAQFGGEKGKKLMKRNFNEYLFTVSQEPIEEQGKLLSSFLEEWQGEEEQVDDVLVIGIEL